MLITSMVAGKKFWKTQAIVQTKIAMKVERELFT